MTVSCGIKRDKAKGGDKMDGQGKKGEGARKPSSVAEAVLGMLDGLGPSMQLSLIEMYDNMPQDAVEAMDAYFKCMAEGVDGPGGVEELKAVLDALGKVSEIHPQYEDFYKAAKREVNKAVSDLYADGKLSV